MPKSRDGHHIMMPEASSADSAIDRILALNRLHHRCRRLRIGRRLLRWVGCRLGGGPGSRFDGRVKGKLESYISVSRSAKPSCKEACTGCHGSRGLRGCPCSKAWELDALSCKISSAAATDPEVLTKQSSPPGIIESCVGWTTPFSPRRCRCCANDSSLRRPPCRCHYRRRQVQQSKFGLYATLVLLGLPIRCTICLPLSSISQNSLDPPEHPTSPFDPT